MLHFESLVAGYYPYKTQYPVREARRKVVSYTDLSDYPRKNTVPVDVSQRYHCKKCTKSYKNKRHLYRHEKEECIDVEPRFKCTICPAMFRRKYHLVRHCNSIH